MSTPHISVPIGYGEFVDKLTILGIKSKMITQPAKAALIAYEQQVLQQLYDEWRRSVSPDIAIRVLQLTTDLYTINARLWNVEDDIRRAHHAKVYDDLFIKLAVAVFTLNAQRAAVKREINELTGSDLVEVKSYATEDQQHV